MNQKGISNVAALLGGTQAWKSAGYPMEGTSQAGTSEGTPASGGVSPGSTPAPGPTRQKFDASRQDPPQP